MSEQLILSFYNPQYTTRAIIYIEIAEALEPNESWGDLPAPKKKYKVTIGDVLSKQGGSGSNTMDDLDEVINTALHMIQNRIENKAWQEWMKEKLRTEGSRE